MRSITAVLRIAREQLEARGGLGKQPYYGVFFGVLSLLGFGASMFAPAELRTTFLAGSAGIMLAALAFGYGSLSTRTARNLNLAQEKEIRNLAGAAVSKILEHDIDLQPLTREQVDTLRDIVKQHPRYASLTKLLDL